MEIPKMEWKIDIKFSPKLTISMGKEKLGSITFSDVRVMGRFMNRLSKEIILLMKEFEEEEERIKNRGVKCRS